MAAKIRAMEVLPGAFDQEYLKLYGVVALGLALSGVGGGLYFGGFPFLGGAVGDVIGVLFGAIVWIPGAIAVLGGLVATTRKVILETTNEEFVKIDRATGAKSSSSEESSSEESAPTRPMHAGSRPDQSSGTPSPSRVENLDDGQDAGDDAGGSPGDARSESAGNAETEESKPE